MSGSEGRLYFSNGKLLQLPIPEYLLSPDTGKFSDFSVCLFGTRLHIKFSCLNILDLFKIFCSSMLKKYRKATVVLNYQLLHFFTLPFIIHLYVGTLMTITVEIACKCRCQCSPWKYKYKC